MGCGSSSLKGDAGDGDKPQAAKRVKTNFSEIDFDRGAAADRRGTMAVAPDEQRRSNKVSEEVPPMPQTPTQPNIESSRAEQADGARLEPYKSIDGDNAFEDQPMPPKQSDKTPQVPLNVDPKPVNEEAAALGTAGTEHANPIKI